MAGCAAARLAAEAAQAGVPEGQALYAYLLATGTGVDQDHAEAEAWYRKALAAADLPQAALGLGVLRISGNGGPADLVEGYLYYNEDTKQFEFSESDCPNMETIAPKGLEKRYDVIYNAGSDGPHHYYHKN